MMNNPVVIHSNHWIWVLEKLLLMGFQNFEIGSTTLVVPQLGLPIYVYYNFDVDNLSNSKVMFDLGWWYAELAYV